MKSRFISPFSRQRQTREQQKSYMSDATVVSIPVDEAGMIISSPTDSNDISTQLQSNHPAHAQYGSSGNPSSARQILLSDEGDDGTQFASYKNQNDVTADLARMNIKEAPPVIDMDNDKKWIPLPLRPWFWVPLIVVLIGGAIALEVTLHFSNKNQGWPTSGEILTQTSVLHYVYTLLPVAIAAIIVGMWAWTDIEIKKMQPYVDLVHGDSPPHRSLLLDYTRTNNFIVWSHAAYNKHYLVALASLMAILCFAFQPLAAALLVVRSTWIQEPDVTKNTLYQIGLNTNSPQFNDLTTFLAAAGYAGASVLYNLTYPPFIKLPYTVAPFQLPTDVMKNGTVTANTTAVKNDGGCVNVTATMLKVGDGAWNNSASFNGCSSEWHVENTTNLLFGTDVMDCGTGEITQYSPILMWFFIYQPEPQASATFCFPKIKLLDVTVDVDIATGNVTKVVELGPFSSSSNFSQFSGNVTGAPLNGRAYNGLQFEPTHIDEFITAREAAIQLQLPAAVYQAAVSSPQGLIESFREQNFATLSSAVYNMYLSLVAREVYYLQVAAPITLQIKTFKNRVWLSDTAVHLLTAAMLLLAFFGTIIHLFHRADRRDLRLMHEPGTIASAVSLGAQTDVGNVLAGRQGQKDISEALQNKKFRIDPLTMKIVMEGETGYENATSPIERRRSVFGAWQRQMSTRHKYTTNHLGSDMPMTPTSS